MGYGKKEHVADILPLGRPCPHVLVTSRERQGIGDLLEGAALSRMEMTFSSVIFPLAIWL